MDARVTRVLELMQAHSADPLTVADLAREVNLSPSYLTRLFQQEIGRSPARFDKERRLERARELLTSTFLTVKEVMAASGWNDPSHFCREYKQRFGVSPRQSRQHRR